MSKKCDSLGKRLVYTLILWFPTLRDKGVIGGADLKRVQTIVREVLHQYGVESARTELGNGTQKGADFYATLEVEVLAPEEREGWMTSVFKAIVTRLTRKPDAKDGGHGLYLAEDTPSTFYKVAVEGDISFIYARTKSRPEGPVVLKDDSCGMMHIEDISDEELEKEVREAVRLSEAW